MTRDPWVEKSQKHLNDTYGSHSWFTRLAVDGQSGWSTMFALTRALQHELGISAKSDSFGPTTMSTLTSKVGSLSAGNAAAHRAITALAQCGLWCKGYQGGATFGSFTADVGAGIVSMRGDMGLSPDPSLTPKAFKSLFTMDAYVRIGAGTNAVRAVQKWMNSRYHSRQDYFIVPCDGIFSRDVQRGLMLALQYEIGMADGVANGNFGPGTQAGIKSSALVSTGSRDSGKAFVRLFQAALTFNGYEAPFDGVFGASTATVVRAFQSFAELGGNGSGDYRTWASLLVSTGDPTRPGTAADASTVLTPETAALLTAHGYTAVGRYLSVAAKRLAPGELDVIFDAGLKVFPIFQEWNNAPGYFTEAAGYGQAVAAAKRARNLGFTAGTTIFFAVDYDATAAEIPALIIPYFRGIARGIASSRLVQYKVGIYGTRNVCAKVSEAGLATSSFVSGMSTGYSGNLGFPLPKNWAYDQVLEYKLSTGGTSLELDKDIASSRADPVGRGQVLPVPVLDRSSSPRYDEAFSWIFTEWNVRAESVGASGISAWEYNDIVLQRMQKPEYWTQDTKWQVFTPPIEGDDPSSSHLKSLAQVRARFETVDVPTRPGTDWYDVAHFAATARSYMRFGVPEATPEASVGDLGGWALDLVTCWRDYVSERREGTFRHGVRQWMRERVGGQGGSFSREDLVADVDAYLAARWMLADKDRTLSDVVREMRLKETSDSRWRASQFYARRFGSTTTTVESAARSMFVRGWWVDLRLQAPAALLLLGSRLPGESNDARDPDGTELAGELHELGVGFRERVQDLVREGL